MVIKVRAQQYDTLDLLCWRHLGTTSGVVEAALELNRNTIFNEATDVTEAAGVILSHGQIVMLPDLPGTSAPAMTTVNLWD